MYCVPEILDSISLWSAAHFAARVIKSNVEIMLLFLYTLVYAFKLE